MGIVTLPIYSKLFGDGDGERNWNEFNSKLDVVDPAEIDFVVNVSEERTWAESAAWSSMVALKIILFPWALFEFHNYLLEKIVTLSILPAQFTSIKEIDRVRKQFLVDFADLGLVLRQVKLQKNGINYSGMLVGLEKNILNGKWALHADGNGVSIEEALPYNIVPHIRTGHNVLLVNLPNVGRSQGWPNPENIGHSQEIGISFLESAIKAKEIVLTGFSLGGAAIGQAILQHDFKKDVKYRVIRYMTFDRLTHLAKSYMGALGGAVMRIG